MQKYFDGCRTCSPPLQVYLAALVSCEMSRDERRNSSLRLRSLGYDAVLFGTGYERSKVVYKLKMEKPGTSKC